jgi:bZIP transcription factor
MSPSTKVAFQKAPPPQSRSSAAQQAALLAPSYSDGEGSSSDTNAVINKQKRPLMTHTKDGEQLSEKKLRRLEKNRLSARECRRRKREATENIQQRIAEMEAENLQLRLQLQIGQEAESCIAKEQNKVTQDINNLLQSGASEADIYATLEEFKEKYADYGKSRRSSIEFHLRQIERLLMPTQTTSVVMHAIQGGDAVTVAPAESRPSDDADPLPQPESYASPLLSGVGGAADHYSMMTAISPSSASVASMHSTDSIVPPPNAVLSSMAVSDVPNPLSRRLDPKTLFQYLVQYLEVTPQQAAAMKDSRLVAQEMDGCLESALAVLSELRQRLAQTGEDLETEFYNVRSILTPTQAAKFLVWVANNDACMHMLNELWDRVYPQPSNK